VNHNYRPQRKSHHGGSVHSQHHKKKKPIIPEKGRIRLLIVGILVFFGVRAVLQYIENNPRPVKEVVEETIVQEDGTVLIVETPVEERPDDLDYQQVKESITEDTPTLLASVDTVTYQDRKIIRYLSLDTVLQNMGNRYMRRYHPKYGAVVILQPRTGRVLSLISYNNPEDTHVADDLYANAEFPSASIFKTVAAAAAIEHSGFVTGTMLEYNGRNHTLYKAQLQKELNPSRKITLGEAYSRSINPVFGRLGMYNIGFNTMNSYAQKFGFNSPVPFELPVQISQYVEPDPTDSFALAEISSGFNQETTLSPILGALIAGAVSNDGKMIRPTLVDSVVDLRSGVKVYARSPQAWRIVMGKSGANELRSIMQGVTQYGTARNSFKTVRDTRVVNGFIHGGKTGNVTRDDYGRTEWFVGFLKDTTSIDEDLACGVFTVHGAYWTVHSSFIGAEMLLKGIRSIQAQKAEIERLRLEREQFVADSTQAVADSIQFVADSTQAVADSIQFVEDSIQAVNDSILAQVVADSLKAVEDSAAQAAREAEESVSADDTSSN